MSQFISLKQAVDMTTLYRQQKEKILASGLDKNILARCETFDRDIFDALLSKPGCSAIRIYYGMDSTLKVHAVVVAVDGSDKDILPDTATLNDVGTDIGEESRRCPDDCPPPSELNP
jgi:hypothetical protein